MDEGSTCDDKREKEVEGKEAGEGSVIYGEAASDSLDKDIPDVGDGGE